MTGETGVARHILLGDLREIAGDLRRSRGLLHELARRDIRVRYKQAVLGIAWALLVPLTVALSGTLVRLLVATATGRSLDHLALAGIAIKSLGWAFFAGAIGLGATSVTANFALVTKVYFPREVLPMAAVVTQAADAAIGAFVLLVALPLLGVQISLALLWVPVLVVLLVCLTVGLVLLLSCANVFFRDVRHLVQLMLTFGIFFTPVFFDAGMFGERGARLLMLNPLAPILEGLRLVIVERHDLLRDAATWHPWYLAYAAICAVAALVGGALTFHRAQRRFAEHV